MNVISVDKLVKRFGKSRALDGVSFDIKEGTVTGFLGPNGAGKTTAMNILMGFIMPSSGSATVLGEPVSPNMAVRRDIGFLSSRMALDKSLTVRQEIDYYAKLSGVGSKYGLELADDLKLDLKAKIGTLSTGNYQKAALIVALLAQPKLLILDEPTNGLDPIIQAEFNKLVKELRAKGTTIFISSHILSEISGICDRFIFIRQGKIVAEVTKDELMAKSGETIAIKSTPDVLKLLKEHKIDYKIESADLEKVFMDYYREGTNV